MKIVVLDGYTLNPGDLSWDNLLKLGECQVFERTPKDLIHERIKDADVVLTNKTVLDRDRINLMDNCKYIGVMATGYNVVDLEAATEKNIIVTNVPAYSTQSVAQMVFAHILNLAQHVANHAETVCLGKWSSSKHFCYWDYPLVELSDKTLGIIGFGRIGQQVARIASAFGMKILAYTDPPSNEILDFVTFVKNVNELFTKSDFVTLHCPLTKDTNEIVNVDRLKLMKPSAFLVNTSRGPLIDENALSVALKNGLIAGAGLDVLSEEPPKSDNPLFGTPNCYITPHISWATLDSRNRLLNIIIDNIQSFIDGEVQNRVNL